MTSYINEAGIFLAGIFGSFLYKFLTPTILFDITFVNLK